MNFAQTPVLENPLVRLEPLSHAHHDDLVTAAEADGLCETWYTRIPSRETMQAEIDRRLALQAQGSMAPWSLVDLRTDRAVGMTTYMALDDANRRLEIGHTWMGTSVQRSGINPAAKLLLLTRAFEELDCVAVEFRTHWHNRQSREAIARLGAKQDGVLRNHQLWPDGSLRDTVVFSIINGEWPAVRNGLQARVERHLRG